MVILGSASIIVMILILLTQKFQFFDKKSTFYRKKYTLNHNESSIGVILGSDSTILVIFRNFSRKSLLFIVKSELLTIMNLL